jgi:hypothetical protein
MKPGSLGRWLKVVAAVAGIATTAVFVGVIAAAFVALFAVMVLRRLDLWVAFLPGLVLLAVAAVLFAGGEGHRSDVLASYSFGFLATGTVAGIVKTSGRRASECES